MHAKLHLGKSGPEWTGLDTDGQPRNGFWRWTESRANRSLANFPANREFYREICEFGLKNRGADVPIWLNKGWLARPLHNYRGNPNRELSPQYQGILIP